jgi:hypothetical protein
LDNSNSIQFSKNNLSNFTIIDNSEFKDSLKSIIFISDDFKSERYILDSEKALYTIKDGKLIFRERFIVDSTTFDQRRVIVSTPTRSDTSDIKPIIFCKSNKNIEAILFDAHPKLLYPFSYIFIRENNNTLKRLYLPGFEDIKEVSLHPKVNSIQFDKDGRLWILTSRHGTYVYDPE